MQSLSLQLQVATGSSFLMFKAMQLEMIESIQINQI